VSRLSVFISYAHADKPLVRRLARSLALHGLKVWIDEGELLVGDSVIERISSAIEEVHFVVAVVSPNSVASAWCRKELALAMSGSLGRQGVKILPLRVNKVPMPPSLADTLYLDLDDDNVQHVAEKLVLAAMRHNVQHEIAASPTAQSPSPAPIEHPGISVEDPLSAYKTANANVDSSLPRMTGTVKWFNSEKGYGFLASEQTGLDYFVHYQQIEKEGYRDLTEGEQVSFKVVPGQRGPTAESVRPL
jgi:cold shock CspA family protein